MISVVKYSQGDDLVRLLRRNVLTMEDVTATVEDILNRVKNEGDDALRRLGRELDGVELRVLEVSQEEFAAAATMVSETFKGAVRMAMSNIEKFHRAQVSQGVDVETMPGVRCVQRSVPINRVGLYVPGGSAPLVSTVLMLAVPAAIAGCKEVIMCTPPNEQGKVSAEILYAAAECGVRCVYKVGGAQAVAAMAYGTQTISAVDKIFGPGNRFVTKAKQIVAMDTVAIDMPAGPSEVMIVADGSAVPAFVAADMLSQAEHGLDSQAVVVADSEALACEIARCAADQAEVLSRGEVVRKALDGSRIIVVDDRDEMVELANAYAAEHLILSVEDPWDIAGRITAAGSVFIGNYSPESAGDYASGTNHTLPTAGWARSHSGVNIDSFVRKITYQELTRDGLDGLAYCITTLAEAEGLDAHANAVRVRMNLE